MKTPSKMKTTLKMKTTSRSEFLDECHNGKSSLQEISHKNGKFEDEELRYDDGECLIENPNLRVEGGQLRMGRQNLRISSRHTNIKYIYIFGHYLLRIMLFCSHFKTMNFPLEKIFNIFQVWLGGLVFDGWCLKLFLCQIHLRLC